MINIDLTVKRETGYIAVWVLILSALMEAVFLVIKMWDLTVLLGNVLGASVAVLNFFLMGVTIQKAVQKEEKDASTFMKASQALRMFMLFLTAGAGALFSFFNLFSTIIPLFFPRIAIAIRPLFNRGSGKDDPGE